MSEENQEQIRKINIDDLRVGMKFSAPVFFDDGKNMFLAENCRLTKKYLALLAHWNIPFLLSRGIPDEEDIPVQENLA